VKQRHIFCPALAKDRRKRRQYGYLDGLVDDLGLSDVDRCSNGDLFDVLDHFRFDHILDLGLNLGFGDD
jgi:hypothetical protein